MNDLKKALESAMQKDVGRFENTQHEFSEEFERRMSKLSENVSDKAKKRHGMRFVRVIAAAAAALALFACGTFAGAASSGFSITRSTRLGLPSKLFTVLDIEDCPETVETVYTLGGFPDNVMSVYENDAGTSVNSMYYPAPWEPDANGDLRAPRDDELYMAKIIQLWQRTKETFEFEYANMEYVTYKPLEINGGQGYFITRERWYGMESWLFWESNDYVFTLAGSFSEERAAELRNSISQEDQL